MLLHENGRFYKSDISFSLPNGLYITSCSEYEDGFHARVIKPDLEAMFYWYSATDALKDLQKMLAEENNGFIPDAPIGEMEIHGVKVYEAFYHNTTKKFYECRFLGADGNFTFCIWGKKGEVENLKDVPVVQEMLAGFRKGEFVPDVPDFSD